MGQARLRGTFEERKALAIKKQMLINKNKKETMPNKKINTSTLKFKSLAESLAAMQMLNK